MNAYEIIENANYDLDHNKITLGEWEKRIEPTKNVKPIVRGEWKNLGFGYGECSVCGNRIMNRFVHNFCSNCGAEMREEREEEE